ncbi:MAG TPA: 2-oxoglutarate dehydrogenase E1 component, partial [Vicinamibacteria bacterium]|nr:2-oxoglutarate dehydrogenase E1 component [Vicinamibacteria bacterium]
MRPDFMEFHAFNAAYVQQLYDRYREDSESVEPAFRSFFDTNSAPLDTDRPGASFRLGDVIGAVQLAHAVRQYGHLAASLDPLGSTPLGDPALDPATHSVDAARLRRLPSDVVGGPVAERTSNAWKAIRELRSVYSNTRGYDYQHLRASEEREWLRNMAESCRFCPPNDPIDEVVLLRRLTEVEVFEQFLHRTFPGRFRFSIEGLDMLIPVLDEVIGEAAEDGLRNIVIGMAHRGRLNVLAHVLGKPYAQILAEFKDPLLTRKFPDELGWTGDVTYHMGARRALKDERAPVDVTVTLPPNPSHVEAIDPVVEGMARAAGTQVDQPGAPRFEHGKTLPILIHGDAAFPGQGVVAETLNLSRLPGYETGGTIHIITNNQLGYTTTPEDAYSTHYASDLAKGFEIPVAHANADDPEACIEVARLAYAYLSRYHKDFVIDLVGYRRFGHNESDEPGFTQPMMYAKIGEHPTVRALWADALRKRRVVKEEEARGFIRERMDELQKALETLEPQKDVSRPTVRTPPAGAARRVETAVPVETLRELNAALLELPRSFRPHPKLERVRKKRQTVLEKIDGKSIDWPTAEELAFATILADGIAIRMSGEDVERGTFSQRHAVFHDVETGEEHVPLQSFSRESAAFEIHNSPLSENAALGFELGYNIQEPGRLVVWEAQYGDFINGAQTVVDEFLVSARAKWGQTPSMVLLLPHGHEGHGPDHSSARLERFLQLAAETNLRIVNCTTAAQY